MTNVVREILFDKSIPIFDAIEFLEQRHAEIVDLFDSYSFAISLAEKQIISKEICRTLIINLHLEDDIFYQEVKRTLMEKHWLSAIAMEHSILKYLLSEIEGLEVDSSVYDIKIKILGEQVANLIKEKQSKFFPKVNSSKKIDLWRLGAQLAARQSFLENAFGDK